MTTFNKLFTISAMAFLLMLMAPHKSIGQNYFSVSDQEFYDNLQQYGSWVYDEQYGNVWVPDVDSDFRPYATNGYWVQTDYGTTWVSDYPWGWATFHYGRWRYDDYYGWEWIPGHQWAPAWVSWRQGGGYYSWAPMQPGVTVDLSFGGGNHVPDNYWVCAPQAYITSRYINRYYAPPARVNYIVNNTTYIHNTYVYNNNTYIVGPRPEDVERVTHKPVTIYKINNAGKPGAARIGGKSINIYRPAIQKTTGAMPLRVVNAKAYKQAHPNDGIGKAGVTANMPANAAKLSAVAHSNKPDNNIVRVNPMPVKRAGQPTANKANTPVQATHPDLAGGHKNVGPVTAPEQQAPATENKHPRKVVPAVMPPADHHDPAIRQPVASAEITAQQKAQAAQQVAQQKDKAAQAAQEKAQANQAAAQARQQAKEQQQANMQQQQAKQEVLQQQKQQAAQARQLAQQQKIQQQQAQQAAAQASLKARQQAKKQQLAAQKAAIQAAKKQQEQQQKQQTPPGN